MKNFLSKILRLSLSGMLAFYSLPVALFAEDGGAPAAPASLQEIHIKGGNVSIKTSAPAAYNVFKVTSPDRLVIELTNTQNNWKRREVVFKNNSYFKRVRAAQFQTTPVRIAHVVLELKKDIEFDSKSEGNLITVSAKATEAPQEPQASAPPTSESMAAAPTPSEMTGAPETANPEASEVSKKPTQGSDSEAADMALLKNAVSQEEKPAPAQPRKPISEPAPAAVQSVPAAEPAPVIPETPKKSAKMEADLSSEPSSLFGRQPVTLDFYDIDVVELFKILSEKAGVNVVFGSGVKGTVSIQLRDVTFKDAVDTVLALADLRMVAMGKNIVQVLSPAEFDKYRTNAISSTKVFPINYAQAMDVSTQLTAILATLGGKGKTLVDARTNSIIVTDTPEGIDQTAKLISDLDKPAPQVMIEAKIVQVSLGKSLDLGITWGISYTDQSGASNQMVTIGAVKDQTTTVPTATPGSVGTVGLQTQSPLNPTGGSGLEQQGSGFAPGNGLGLTFGFVKDVVRLNAALSALQQKNKSKILSNPKIATLNNQAATIQSTVNEPYITTQTQLTNAGTLATQVVNSAQSGISLKVTPTINADGRITMKIIPDITSSQPTSIGVPKTTSQSANTTVIVKDGETFVIGGLISEQESDARQYVPILGAIPIIGHLFKKTSTSKNRAELLVFVTPRVIPY